MKKIGIITLCDYHNYGNRLQNYAVQNILEEMGFSVKTIRNTPIQKKSSLIKKIIRNKDNLINVITTKYENVIYNKIRNKKTQRSIDFTNRYINETNFTISENILPKNISDEFDYFVTGSDQVWNPNFNRGSMIEFLAFASQSKRISFSASFGISEIPDHLKYFFKEHLSQMEHISVRELAGAMIVKNLTGRDVEVLVDPTMLLSKEKWLLLARKPNFKPNKNYILTYFLGDGKNMKWIKRISAKYNYDIISLADVHNDQAYLTDPSEFLDLINGASLVCTDSFHGSVFSIIMKTNFVVFNRIEKDKTTKGMESRTDTLLKIFELTSRKWSFSMRDNELFTTDFNHIDTILLSEQKKALNYLKKSLDVF